MNYDIKRLKCPTLADTHTAVACNSLSHVALSMALSGNADQIN